MRIDGKTAIVSGGASGLGAATVRKLNSLGARVVIVDVNQDDGKALQGELGEGVYFSETDITQSQPVEQAITRAVEDNQGLHILINCAGIAPPEKVLGKEEPHDLDRYGQVLNVNLVGTFNTLRLAAAAMTRNPPDSEGERGVIINTASVAAFEGQIGQTAYAASKGGIVSMTLPAARELARYGIRVNSIAPGMFDTPLLAGLPEQARASLGEQVPFPPRLGRPQEYAALVQHIVENTMLNGTTIRLDGALRMGSQ